MEPKKFVYVSYIKTTPEKLWSALTEGKFVRQYWYGHGVESDWKVGSVVTFPDKNGGTNIRGKVLKSDRPHLLSYTFQPEWKDEWKGEAPSRVSFEINPEDGWVKLTLTHDEFAPGSTVPQDITHGWPLILSGLKSLLETGEVPASA